MEKTIDGFDLYSITAAGEVTNRKTGKRLKPSDNGGGYKQVVLCKGQKTVKKYIHRLVAAAFIDNPDGKPEVNHISGDKSDNSIKNLEWATRSDNERHAWGRGLKSRKACVSNAKLTDGAVKLMRDLLGAGMSGVMCSQMFGVSPSTVSMVKNGNIWREA
jgi:hypothetical protein